MVHVFKISFDAESARMVFNFVKVVEVSKLVPIETATRTLEFHFKRHLNHSSIGAFGVEGNFETN